MTAPGLMRPAADEMVHLGGSGGAALGEKGRMVSVARLSLRMPRWFPSRGGSWMDVAILIAGVAVLVLAAYVGFTFWSASAAPVAPATDTSAAGAAAHYRSLLKRNPADVSALSGLANAEMAQNDLKSAETHWRKVIALLSPASAKAIDPMLEQAYYGLGVASLEMHRYQNAVAALARSEAMKSDASDTHYMLSVAYRELGRTDAQRAELLSTVRMDPENAQAQYDLGLLALAQGDVASAAELFRISADYAPESIRLPKNQLDRLAASAGSSQRLARAQGLVSTDAAAALAEARIAAALNPADVVAVRLVASLWEKKGDRARALNAYRRLLELEPGDRAAGRAIKRLGTDGK